MKVVLEEEEGSLFKWSTVVESGEGWGSPEDLCTSSLLESLLSHKKVKKERVDWLREEEDASNDSCQRDGC